MSRAIQAARKIAKQVPFARKLAQKVRKYRKDRSESKRTQVDALIEELSATRLLLSAVEVERECLRDLRFGGIDAILDTLRTTLVPQVEEMFRLQMNNRVNSSALASGKSIACGGLYLDLLERCLTGMIVENPSTESGADGKCDPATRAAGREWPSQGQTRVGSARMRNLRQLCETVITEGVPGDFIEAGVRRDGACIYMRGILAAHGDTSRRVFVADSVRGLPERNEMEYRRDGEHTRSSGQMSRQEVEANFRQYGLLDGRIVFLDGWFKDTLPAAPVEVLSVVRLDGDTYESTIGRLEVLCGKVSPGGFVIVDNYTLPACRQAVEDFRSRNKIEAELHGVDAAAMWWQVPRT
jgi:O-methyltransferase/8-demethyl-8-(2,3-dimethoxy-alpha-L-rhamnosyl)tetracenomycin-C 4'-O-methyltransferase